MARRNGAEDVAERPDGPTAFESKLVNLLALLLVQQRKQVEQIGLLSRAGFRPNEIASLLGTTPNTVSVQLSAQKREKRRVSKRRSR
jgi:hypothetical protein